MKHLTSERLTSRQLRVVSCGERAISRGVHYSVRRIWLIVIVTGSLCTTPCRGLSGADELKKSLSRRLTSASRAKLYVPPERDELKRVENLFARTFSDVNARELSNKWDHLGFMFSRHVDSNGADVWILSEKDMNKRGRGVYAFRRDHEQAIAVQAPHSFHDLDTRKIAIELFQTSPLAAAAWNTIHRSTIDVAHSSFHYMNAFTRAFAQAHHDSLVVQLHGFSQSKRFGMDASRADMILSNGTRFPKPWLRGAGIQFQSDLAPLVVRIFPWEIRELGGTTNVQARTIRTIDSAEFLSIEMSRALRQQLAESKEARASFLKSLQATHRRIRSRKIFPVKKDFSNTSS